MPEDTEIKVAFLIDYGLASQYRLNQLSSHI